MRNVSNKSCRENQNTHFLSSNFSSENCVVCEIMSKFMMEPERPPIPIWRRVACWIIEATRAQSQSRCVHPPHTEICNTYCFSRACYSAFYSACYSVCYSDCYRAYYSACYSAPSSWKALKKLISKYNNRENAELPTADDS